MAESLEQGYEPEKTVVVLNFPADIGEEELTIHFQKEKNGGGDVDEVVVDGSVAFVVFDSPEVATSVLNHPEQVIDGTKIEVQSYESWLANKKKKDRPSGNRPVRDTVSEDAVTTIYVSGLKDSTTTDAITYFFENKKRTGGGDLREGKEGFKRLSATVARLTFVSSQDAQGVIEKAKITPLQLEGQFLTVSSKFIPTHDQSILLAKNLNPKTSKETFINFVESTKNADVFNVVFGKDHKAIVILKSTIDADEDDSEGENQDMKLDGFKISLEFAPLTKGIKISNIPQDTTTDDIKFKFSNKKIGGGKVMDMLHKKNGVANVYFEKSSVVSDLVKKRHALKDVPLTVIPCYDDFEELEEKKTKNYTGDCPVDPVAMDYIMKTQRIDEKFDFKSSEFNTETSRFHFTKEFEDPKDAEEFKTRVKEFLLQFVKEEVKFSKNRSIFQKVVKEIESKDEEFETNEVQIRFDVSSVTLVGKKEDVFHRKQSIEATTDRITEETKFSSEDLKIDDQNKLKFLNCINYFENVMKEFPPVKIRGTESSSGEMSILGPAEKIKDVQLKIYKGLPEISEVDVKASARQIDFLQRTGCEIVNDELKKRNAMLFLINVEGALGDKAYQAKIMTLKKCDGDEKKRLLKTVDVKTSEKLISLEEETVMFLKESNKLQEFKKEQFDKHQVMIEPELTDLRNIWIVCEKSKIHNAEKELRGLTDEKKIDSCDFTTQEPMEFRFLMEHCWDDIKEKEKSCKAEGVIVFDIKHDSLKVKGTKAGRDEMINFLKRLVNNIDSKTYPLNEPGMKKQMKMDTTDAIISDVEKNHRCVIEKDVPGRRRHKKRRRATSAKAVAGNNGSSTTMNLPYQSMSFVNDQEVKLASGQKITIVIGDLARQTVDVIVNTTNEKVDLKGNPCGKALLKVAGQELVNECKKIGSLQPGEMASTGPAKLNCKRVYHVRSSHWDNGNGALVLRQIMQNSLGQLEKDMLTSISIPAIGTGNLGFPRPKVAEIFFEEVTSYLTAHPQSTINDVRFVAYDKDQATVDAFLGAVQEIKSKILSPASTPIGAAGQTAGPAQVQTTAVAPIQVPATAPITATSTATVTTPSTTKATANEKPDGSLEISFPSSNLAVQVVCDDISKETTDLIMHVIDGGFSFQGGVAKALVKAGGVSIVQECKALGQPALFTTQYTKAGNLSVNQIAHVIGNGKPSYGDLKKCLDNFFDDIDKKNIAKVSFSAIGTGGMGYSEEESVDLIFDNLFRIARSKNTTLSLVRIVIFEKGKFMKFKDEAKAYISSECDADPAKTTGIFLRIYSDDERKIGKAWDKLKKKIDENIDERPVRDDMIKKFTVNDLENLRKLERDLDFVIKVDKNQGEVTFKGHVHDIPSVQEKINEIVKEKYNEGLKNVANSNVSQVPSHWSPKPDNRKYHKFALQTSSQEYKNIETAFRATAPNQIVSIERIQNEEIYGLFNTKRQLMMKKYGSKFQNMEKRLFHGTAPQNVDKINAGGLNRSYAGAHAIACGRGVYFAVNASYSCSRTYSPADFQGNRYMYYANVLVGEYANGNSSMIVAPSKSTSDPNDRYDSVVNDVTNPIMYVLFQDYEYYTEYLITFR